MKKESSRDGWVVLYAVPDAIVRLVKFVAILARRESAEKTAVHQYFHGVWCVDRHIQDQPWHRLLTCLWPTQRRHAC